MNLKNFFKRGEDKKIEDELEEAFQRGLITEEEKLALKVKRAEKKFKEYLESKSKKKR
jgi:hypothetical protein